MGVSAPVIAFDEESHTYRVDGRIVKSVTQINDHFARICEKVDAELLEYTGQRGKAVHRATELDDHGTLDESSVDPVVAPYLAQWRRFKSECHIEMLEIEHRLYNRLCRYIGTCDRICTINGKRAILDIKTGVKSKWHQLQTAGYAMADEASSGRLIEARYSLHLTPERYNLIQHKDPNDRTNFLSAVNLYHFMQGA